MAQQSTSHPYIDRDQQISRGSPVIRGTRVRVVDLVIEYENLGRHPDHIIQSHPQISLAQLHDALSYYYERREAIDTEIESRKDRVAELEDRYHAETSR